MDEYHQRKMTIQSKLGNYIPKEVLQFYNIDLRLIDPIMQFQEQAINNQEVKESNLYGKDLDFIVARTDDMRNDVRQFLLNVLRREELFKVKVDCIQKTLNITKEENPCGQNNQQT